MEAQTNVEASLKIYSVVAEVLRTGGHWLTIHLDIKVANPPESLEPS